MWWYEMLSVWWQFLSSLMLALLSSRLSSNGVVVAAGEGVGCMAAAAHSVGVDGEGVVVVGSSGGIFTGVVGEAAGCRGGSVVVVEVVAVRNRRMSACFLAKLEGLSVLLCFFFALSASFFLFAFFFLFLDHFLRLRLQGLSICRSAS